MPFDKPLHDLLEKPFGPYLEELVLTDRCKFMASKRLFLDAFQLAYNDEPTGFDRTEFEGNMTPSNVAHLPPISSGSLVLFRGILSLQTFSQLSEEGKAHLDEDFKERAMRSAINGVLGAKKHANLDMVAIFALKSKQKNTPEAEKYNIRLLIQGYMHSTASFMRSELAPNGLLFHATNADKTKFRVYQIVSMDIETYKLSRTFLFRHHTLRAMRDILSRAAAAGVPASQCTLQWFIDKYLSHCAYPSSSIWQRINFLEGAESSDEGLDMSAKQMTRPSDAQTHIPRHLRRVHKNEIWSIFSSHSEWILSLIENHKDLKGKVNSQSWKIFLSSVSNFRQTALLDQDTNRRWGIKDEKMDKQTILPLSLFMEPTESIMSKVKKAKIKKSFTKPSISVTNLEAFSTLTSAPQNEDQLDNIYDSDFSQGSLSPTPSPPDPSLIALIPDEMLHPPTIPTNMLWHCPIGGTCSYTIDLCAPSVANLRSVDTTASQAQDAIYLLEKQWKSNDKQLCMIFNEMVHAHWEDHLKELDIRYIHQGDDSHFEWIHPQRHAPWPSQKWKVMKAHREQCLRLELRPAGSPEL